MIEYKILPADTAAEIAGQLRRLADLLSQAGDLTLPELNGRGSVNLPSVTASGTGIVERPTKKKYRIGRGKGKTGYIEVVNKEVEADVFSLNEIWSALEPLIIAKSDRPRDAIRVALDRDDGFTRIKGRDGVWWSRVRTADEQEVTEE